MNYTDVQQTRAQVQQGLCLHEEHVHKENAGSKTTDTDISTEHIQTSTYTSVKHTQIAQCLRGAAHPDKTGSLRAIYSHLIPNDPPISDYVGREMR